jgi:hypothetical protein
MHVQHVNMAGFVKHLHCDAWQWMRWYGNFYIGEKSVFLFCVPFRWRSTESVEQHVSATVDAVIWRCRADRRTLQFIGNNEVCVM